MRNSQQSKVQYPPRGYKEMSSILGIGGSQPMSTAVHRSPSKLWRSNSKFNLWFPPTQWNLRGGRCSSVKYKYKQKYIYQLASMPFIFHANYFHSLILSVPVCWLRYTPAAHLILKSLLIWKQVFIQVLCKSEHSNKMLSTDHNFSSPLMFPFLKYHKNSNVMP
jgi:hypothetical protein